MVTGEAMPWLTDIDVGAAHGFARALLEARTVTELRSRALPGLAELVPADVLMWDRVELDSGLVRHEVIPADAEPPGAFATIVADVTEHPLLSAHAARRHAALRLSEAVEPRRLSHSTFYGDLLRPSGVEYAITIGIRTERREMLVAGLGRSERLFSERDREVLDLVRPGLENAVRAARAHERLAHALATRPPPGTAIVLLDRYGEIEHSSLDSDRWLTEHFGAASTRAGYPSPSLSGSLCHRGRRSSANETDGASPSTCCPATRTRCCWKRTSRPSARTHSIASA